MKALSWVESISTKSRWKTQSEDLPDEGNSEPGAVNARVVESSLVLVKGGAGSGGDDELKEGEEHHDSDNSGGEERVSGEDEGGDEEDEGEEHRPTFGKHTLNNYCSARVSVEGTLGEESCRKSESDDGEDESQGEKRDGGGFRLFSQRTTSSAMYSDRIWCSYVIRQR